MQDVVEFKKKILKKFLKKECSGSFFTLVALLILAGCQKESSVASFCQELPNAQADIYAFRSELVPYLPPSGKAQGRKIASIDTLKVPERAPSPETRAAWLNWTEKTLKRTQWTRDALENDPSTRKVFPSLDAVSMSLVSIHGFLDQMKWKKVSSELEKIDRNLKKAYEVACVAPKKKS